MPMGLHADRWAGYQPPSYIVQDNWPVPGDWQQSRAQSRLFRLYWRMIELCDPKARRLNYEDPEPLELSQKFFDYADFKDWFVGKYGLDALMAVDNPGFTTWMLNCTRFSRFKGTFSPTQTKLYTGWAGAALSGKPKIPVVRHKEKKKKPQSQSWRNNPKNPMRGRTTGVENMSGYYIGWKHFGEQFYTDFHDDEETALAEYFDAKLDQFDEIIAMEFDPDIIQRLKNRRKMLVHLRDEALGLE